MSAKGSHNVPEDADTTFECGTPYKYAPKREEGVDYWARLLGPMQKRDRAQCETWRDELKNLLIFAGLFSAIITAFLVESYKTLKEDPNETTVVLLKQIATSIGNTSSMAPPSPPQFSPTHSDIRVNIFWFLSLVLSLATVLVGVVSLQWLREHQSYPEDFSAEKTFALLHMRTETLQHWRVSAFFTALPVLLQIALLLFFAGLADFLIALGSIPVAIPIVVAIGISITFLLATTALPGLHLLVLAFKSPSTIPVPSPYKSPQAELFRSGLSLAYLRIVQPTFCLITSFLFYISGEKKQTRTPSVELYEDLLLIQVWRDLDLKCMFLRQISSARLLAAGRGPGDCEQLDEGWIHHENSLLPFYDQLQAILRVHSLFPTHQVIIHAAYHCFVDFLGWSSNETRPDRRLNLGVINKMLDNGARQWHLPGDNPAFLQEHTLLLFLCKTGMAKTLGKQYPITHELHFRMRHFFYRVYVPLQHELEVLPRHLSLYGWNTDGPSFDYGFTVTEKKCSLFAGLREHDQAYLFSFVQALGDGGMHWLGFQFQLWFVEDHVRKSMETLPYPTVLRAAAFLAHSMENHLNSASPQDPGSDGPYLPAAVQAAMVAIRIVCEACESCRAKNRDAALPEEVFHLFHTVVRFSGALLSNREAPHIRRACKVIGAMWGERTEEGGVWRLETSRRKIGVVLKLYQKLRNTPPPTFFLAKLWASGAGGGRERSA